MASHVLRGAGVLGVAFLLACGSGRDATTRRYAVLSDARSDGAVGFFFLPPVAPEPTPAPANDPSLSPEVEIAALGSGGALLVRFEGDAVKASGAHFMVQWSTKAAPPVAGTTYRITVLVDGKALGFADAAVAANGKELRLLATGEVFGLTGQRTVPIKFAVVRPEDPCDWVTCEPPTQCQVSVTCDPALASCVASAQPPGTPCDDGSFCTVGDACDGTGGCVAGTGSPCAASDSAASAADAQCNPLEGCDATASACVYARLVDTDCTATLFEQPVPGTCRAGEGGPSVCLPVPPAGLTYEANPVAYTIGQEIVPNAPSYTGGPAVLFEVTPALPAGLALDPATGVISGTPTAITAPAVYVVTASNPGGSASVELELRVNDLPPVVDVGWCTGCCTALVGSYYRFTLPATSCNPDERGGAVVSWSVVSELPSWLTFDPDTGEFFGRPTFAGERQIWITVTGTNSGGSATDSFLVMVSGR